MQTCFDAAAISISNDRMWSRGSSTHFKFVQQCWAEATYNAASWGDSLLPVPIRALPEHDGEMTFLTLLASFLPLSSPPFLLLLADKIMSRSSLNSKGAQTIRQ